MKYAQQTLTVFKYFQKLSRRYAIYGQQPDPLLYRPTWKSSLYCPLMHLKLFVRGGERGSTRVREAVNPEDVIVPYLVVSTSNFPLPWL